jgi:hypothetical protein
MVLALTDSRYLWQALTFELEFKQFRGSDRMTTSISKKDLRASSLQARRQALRGQQTQTPQILEASTVLAVNLLLSIAALVSLFHLVPYQFAQVQKLQEMRAEVDRTESRVNRIKTQLTQNLDPKQTSRIVEEQSSLIEAQQMKVIWVKPASNTPTSPSSPPAP